MAIMSSTQRGTAPRAAHVATRRVRDDLWRVVSASGLALGYIARVDGPGGPAFESRRLLPGGTTLLPIGRGWSLDDALACFTGP
ncbi:hypothetical protein D8Y24_10000 [Agrococcus lahaulensis]|jgi:hypothetical protein|uniref:hypothetical protein n=2 Tax=Microbacteriaceae TaxID=85023 RepID=UPI000FE386CB|nr:hypothetical protein [Agrococcus sp. BE272]RWR20334.1 hypothetical protein D8Y24_10000 [Agrococcus lahaulensis]